MHEMHDAMSDAVYGDGLSAARGVLFGSVLGIGFWSMVAVEAGFTILKVLSNVAVSLFIEDPRVLILLQIRSPLVLAVGLGVTIGTYLHYRRD